MLVLHGIRHCIRLVANFSHKSVGNFYSANPIKKAKGDIMGAKTGSVIIYNIFSRKDLTFRRVRTLLLSDVRGHISGTFALFSNPVKISLF